jgi:hypothetical protein
MKRSHPIFVKRRRLVFATFLLLLMGAVSIPAAILQIEDFNVDPSPGSSDWYSRDGEMDVVWDANSLLGTFEAQDVPFFQSDAFRIDSPPWIGNYDVLNPSYSQFTFDFMAMTVLPSTFIVRISNGGTTFIRNLLPQLSGTGMWIPGIQIPLSYDASWLGGDALAFDATMQSVSFIDIQVGRSGVAEQQYRLDNFTLLDDPLDPGGGGDPSSAVPEPNAVSFIAAGCLVLYAVRRHLGRVRAGQPA